MLKKDTESITLRLDRKLVRALKKHAQNSEIGINTLANQIFKGFVEWDMTATKAGWAVMQRDVLKELFNELTEEKLKEIAVRTADNTVDIRLNMTGEDTLEAFYLILRGRLKRSGFRYSESQDGDVKRIVIQHDMSEKWSIFFKTHYQRMLERMGYPAGISYTANTLAMEITERPTSASFSKLGSDSISLRQ